MYWYNKYMNKMKYIEGNYRKTNIYTKYHEQLEQPICNNNDIEPVIATVVEPSCPIKYDETFIVD